MSGPAGLGARLFSAAGRILRRRSMRWIVRVATRAHVRLFRATTGRAGFGGYPILLLTVPGRRTGTLRTTPLVYARDGERFLIAASYAGSDADPAWWRNLEAAGGGRVEVDGRRLAVRVDRATPEERPVLWDRLCRVYPFFPEYQERTPRPIPVGILTPVEPA